MQAHRHRVGIAGLVATAVPLLAASLSLLLSAASVASTAGSADRVYRNGVIFTADDANSGAQALAIRDGRIIYVGNNEGLAPYIDAKTVAVDLKGRFVMPGLIDGHMHPLDAGSQLLKCNLNYASLTVAEFQQRIQACLDQTASKEPDAWLEVVNWFQEIMRPAGITTNRAMLDALKTNRPIIVLSSQGHTGLANTRALALANITSATPDPSGGKIWRDAKGQPTGLLDDPPAYQLVTVVEPKPTPEQDTASAAAALAAMRRQGVTSFLDAWAPPEDMAAFASLRKSGKLTARAHFAPEIPAAEASSLDAAVTRVLDFRAQYDEGPITRAPSITVRNAKFFLDGIIYAPAFTGAMVDPYLHNAGTAEKPRWVPSDSRGPPVHFSPEVLATALVSLGRAGIDPHMHADGDGAVRAALDGVAALRKALPAVDIRPAIAHDEIVTPADFPRFKALGAIPVLSFQWEQPAGYTLGLRDYFGPARMKILEPAGLLAAAGARIAFGSDWPVDKLDEWFALKVGVTRTSTPDAPAEYRGRLGDDPGLSRETVLRAATINAAYELHQDAATGSLEVGKLADLIVLDRNPLAVPAEEIAKTQVLETVVGGAVAYEAAESPFGAVGTSGPPTSIADQVFLDGTIYTQDPVQPWAEGLAIAGGKYLAVGTNTAIRTLVGPKTLVVDLKGRMIMSGLIDDHVHAVDGALGELYDCLFASSSTPEQIRQILASCVKRTPKGIWITGGHWASDFFTQYPIASPRKWLDDIAGERPVILRDDTGHNVWANSAALRLAGVDSDAADPTGGRFEREASSGKPNGMALEAAAEKIQAAVPEPTAKQYQRSVSHVQNLAHRLGFIGLKEADASTPTIAAYQAADKQGELHLYVATCISTLAMQDKPSTVLNFDAIDEVRAAYRSNLVTTDFVKIYLDGVPTAARTAAMLEPYLPDADGKRVSGNLHVDPEVLANDVTELDRRGYTIKMHAAGDRAIRVGLDAIAAARRANPNGRLRHELAHAGYIAAEDIGRFAELNAVAEFSPVIWYPSPIIDAVIAAVGERAKHYWPMRSLLATHAPLAAGSDWPSVVPSMDPWGGIEAMVTRSDPYHHSAQTLWPEEAIGLADALRIYTLGNAAALRRETQTGSIVVGKSADFIVLDRNLFEVPVNQISDTQVQMTFFQGRLVYRRPVIKGAVKHQKQIDRVQT